MPPTRPLRPIIPNNACPLRITAAAGTELAGASSSGTVTPLPLFTEGISSHLTGFYDPKAFIIHAALLRQAFAHCAKFLTAASRRSLDRVSVPVWPITLSGRLLIEALVGHYPTNKLIRRRLLLKHQVLRSPALIPSSKEVGMLCGISPSFPGLFPTRGQITHVLLTRAPLYRVPEGTFLVRLACVRHAASVRSEP